MTIGTYPPQNVNGGPVVLAAVPITTGGNQALSAGTEANLTGYTATVTVAAGRRLKITVQGQVYSTVLDDGVAIRIKEDGTQIFLGEVSGLTSAIAQTYTMEMVHVPAPGTHTYTVTAQRVAGSGTVTHRSNTSSIGLLLVEDITGNQLPVLPQSVPVGVLAQSIMASDVTGITTTPGIIGTINIAVPAGRTIKLSGFATVQSSNAGEQIYLTFREGGTVLKYMEVRPQLANVGEGFYFEWIFSPSAGAHTYVFDFSRGFSATGTLSSAGADNRRGWLVAEDITPTPAAGTGAPGSTLGYAESTSLSQAITTVTDLTNLSVTVTVPAGRRLKITGACYAQNAAANNRSRLGINEGATQLNGEMLNHSEAAVNESLQVVAIVTPSAGTHTYKLTGTSLDTNTSTFGGVATQPAYILVEDITGAVWPVGSSVTAGMVASEAWTAYVPQLKASVTDPTMGTGAQLVGRYIKMGRTVYGTCYIRFGTSGTAAGSGTYRVVLPVPGKPSTETTNSLYVAANGMVLQGTNSASVIGMLENTDGTYIELAYAVPGGPGVRVTHALPSAWGANDSIRLSLQYEAAV